MTEEESRDVSYNDLLLALDNYFGDYNRCNADFKLAMPRLHLQNVDIIEDPSDHDPDATSFFDENHGNLNDEQLLLFNAIAEDISNDRGGLHRFDAPGGCGKTYLSNIILSYVRKSGKVALATALSGIASTILRLGKTFHRQFGAPIPCYSDSCSNLKINSKEACLIVASSLIMVDEVSMMNWKLLDMLDRFLRLLMDNDTYMGGKCVILTGDLRQCPPVVTGGKRPAIVSASVINSEIWSQFTAHRLTINMRVERLISASPERATMLQDYAKWLLQLGNGKLHTVFNDIIEVPSKMVCKTPSEYIQRYNRGAIQNGMQDSK